MEFLEKVREKREKLAAVLSDEEYSGIRELVEELYPDKAHFIYELLQNAEDVGAKEASFRLLEDRLVFEHDGETFTEDNVWAITNIGKGTKRTDQEKIGKFGVGFKAVFSYTETPRVWSKTFSFEIINLVLPTELLKRTDIRDRTRFEFPFNNPKKPKEDAYQEVVAGLNELAETTLLFLNNIESIRWRIGNSEGEVLRTAHSDHHIEILRQNDRKTTSSSHFLRFTEPVSGLKNQRVAVAFELSPINGESSFDSRQNLSKQLRITSANPGRVAVSFPAEKEFSGLRFHLHAPFVPELSRASIKESPKNAPLFDQLAELSSKSLYIVRNLGLLNVDFLAVLPNPQDEISSRYEPIRAAIVAAMNEELLTPTYEKSHAPASELLQAKAALKSLLTTEDLVFVNPNDSESPKWAAGATQKNSNADRFLEGLEIRNWDIGDFVTTISRLENEEFTEWIGAKSAEWHQEMYALLYNEYSATEGWFQFQYLELVRLENNDYATGRGSYFPTATVKHDEAFPRVDESVYSSGKRKTQQQAARKFLEAIGVREVGEVEEIKAILAARYQKDGDQPDDTTHVKDLRRFFAIVENNPETAEIFLDYHVFVNADKEWSKSTNCYLDEPFQTTGLSDFYFALGEDADKSGLWNGYSTNGISLKRMVKFAKLVGVQYELEVTEIECMENPERVHLWRVPGNRYTYSQIDRDFTVLNLNKALKKPTVEMSRLIWQFMNSLPSYPNYLRATFQKNEANGAHHAASQLVHILCNADWIPQEDGEFVKPIDADRDLLLEGFPYDSGDKWLEAVKFGQASVQRREENIKKEKLAQSAGFENLDILLRARRFAALPEEEQERILEASEQRNIPPFPERESKAADRRRERVNEQAEDANDRDTEKRTRSISVGLGEVKEEAKRYLSAQYTNDDGELFCQLCKRPMPFKLDDGTYYFEAVEFLGSLKKRHYQNYLALCPNHSAMFRHANGSEKLMYDMFLELESIELDVVLTQKDMSIKFTQIHIDDLKNVVATDKKSKE